jgi:prevent-host-death family protein
MESIPLTRAKARLSGIVNRLIHVKANVVITKHGKRIAVLLPYEDWVRLQSAGTTGLGGAVPPSRDSDGEIDGMVAEIYAARSKSKARKPSL